MSENINRICITPISAQKIKDFVDNIGMNVFGTSDLRYYGIELSTNEMQRAFTYLKSTDEIEKWSSARNHTKWKRKW